MKIKVVCDNGANIKSKKEEKVDLSFFGCETKEEWDQIPEEARMDMVKEWAMEQFNWWYEVE